MCRVGEELGTLPGPPRREKRRRAGLAHCMGKPRQLEKSLPASACGCSVFPPPSLKTKYQAGWESQEETLKC